MRLLRLLSLLFLLACAACSQQANPEEAYEQADRAYRNGLFMEAEGLYEKYLQLNPRGAHRWETFNRLFEIESVVKGDVEKAQTVLEAMNLEFGADSGRAYRVLMLLGDLNASAGRPEKAVEVWRKALGKLEPGKGVENVCALALRLSRAYQTAGHYDQSRDVLLECIRAEPPASCQTACKLELAQTYTFIENWGEAKELLNELLQSDGLAPEESSFAAFLLSDIFIHEDRYGEARTLLESIRETYPNPKAVEAKISRLP